MTVSTDSIPKNITIDGQGEFGLVRDVYKALAGIDGIEIKNTVFLG